MGVGGAGVLMSAIWRGGRKRRMMMKGGCMTIGRENPSFLGGRGGMGVLGPRRRRRVRVRVRGGTNCVRRRVCRIICRLRIIIVSNLHSRIRGDRRGTFILLEEGELNLVSNRRLRSTNLTTPRMAPNNNNSSVRPDRVAVSPPRT